MTFPNDRIPKKAKPSDKPSKKCKLCEKYGGKPLNHYTNKCKKYNPDGSVKKTLERVKRVHLWDMMFDIPYLADWKQIGDFRQRQTDRNTARENKSCVAWDYKVGDEILLQKDGIIKRTLDYYTGSYEWYSYGSTRNKLRTLQH